MTTRRSAKLALATSLVLALGTTGALAGGPGEEVQVDSTVKLREKFPAFHGKVIADNSNCVADRVVKLFKEKRSGDKKLLGTDTTGSDGKWAVNIEPLKSGAYFAVVKKYENATAGPIYVCLRAKSQTAVVD